MNGYVNATITKPELGDDYVGYFSTATAAAAAVLSQVFGSLQMRYGTKDPFILLGSLCFFATPAMVLVFSMKGWGHGLILPYLLQGSGRAVYESTNRGVFADFFPDAKAEG